MQENEFEKNVRKKMDDLKFSPSDSVWQNIEAHMRKQKPRKRILLFWIVTLAGLLYGGYVLLNKRDLSSGSSNELATKFVKKESKRLYPVSNLDSVNSNQPGKKNNTLFKGAGTEKFNTGITTVTGDKLKARHYYQPQPPINQNININKEAFERTRDAVEDKQSTIYISNKEQQRSSINILKHPDSIIIANKELSNKKADSSASDFIRKTVDSIINKQENALTANKESSVTKKYLWNWGVTFSAGASGTANSLLGSLLGSEQKSFDGIISNNPSTNPGSSYGNGSNFPSLIKPSSAFFIGFVAEKNVLPKIVFSTGLNYKLFSTTNQVGTDSAAYYRSITANSAGNSYHNNYHYLELPVGFKFKIINAAKTQLFWNAGFSISHFINSNALQYNNVTGLYYKDNSQFNKTQFGFNSGVDIALFSKQKSTLLIGPYFNYGISKMASEGYNKRHFTYIGLRSQVIFKRK
jgi:hypothetical protein